MNDMAHRKSPSLEDVWMDRESILGRVWLHLRELSVNQDTMLYFYSALELRFFIESVFFEMAARFKNGKLNKRDLKVYKPKEIAARLYEADHDLFFITCKDMAISITRDDLTQMMTLYGQLGRYLHLPKEIFIHRDQEDWKHGFEVLVIKTFQYLNRLIGEKWPTK